MRFLLYQNLLHAMRSRLIGFSVLVAFLFQFCIVKLLRSSTIQFQDFLMVIAWKEALFVALFFQMFVGSFLASVYGIWILPYLHTGSRSALTHVLPVRHSEFAIGYILTLVFLFALTYIVMILNYSLIFGFSVFMQPEFPWWNLIYASLMELIAVIFMAFAFAVSSMTIGTVGTVFLSGLVISALQILAVIVRFDIGSYLQGEVPKSYTVLQTIYPYFPPLGDIVFTLKSAFFRKEMATMDWAVWLVWCALAIGLFILRIRKPSTRASQEGV